jgi:S-sulfo-L-cysteine synthase (3-phospho-L-serine-dependent)
VHWVSAAEAFHSTNLLFRTHGLFMGGTSGAAYLVADWWAQQNPDTTVVCILPDKGYRYKESIYNDQWLRDTEVWLDRLPAEPCLVSAPSEAVVNKNWCRMLWERRSYEQVIGHPFLQGEER